MDVFLAFRQKQSFYALCYVLIVLTGLYTSARDHFTYERCMKQGDYDVNLNCGLDYHSDTIGNLKADFNVSGTFSAFLQTQHSVDIIHHHDQEKVRAHKHFKQGKVILIIISM